MVLGSKEKIWMRKRLGWSFADSDSPDGSYAFLVAARHSWLERFIKMFVY